METKYIDVDGYWGVIVCYDYGFNDYDDIWSICRSFGLSNKKTNKALRVLSEMNTGMTISNYDIRMSVVFISKATSESEWWSTCIHELKHVTDAIIDYYDKDWDGEPSAYLNGFLMKRVVEEITEPCW